MAENTPQQPLTSLEQKVMQDYGKYTYKAVPVPTYQDYITRGNTRSTFPLASFGVFQPKVKAQDQYNTYLQQLPNALPEGIEMVGNELRITPNSSLYNAGKSNEDIYTMIRNEAAKKAQLDAYNAARQKAGKETLSAMPTGTSIFTDPLYRQFSNIGAFGGLTQRTNNANAFFGGNFMGGGYQRSKPYSGPLSVLAGDVPSRYNTMGATFFNPGYNRFQNPLANAKTGEATRTYDEAMQEYLRNSGGATNPMTLDQLKSQIETNRQAMQQNQNLIAAGNTNTEDILNNYYAPPMPEPLTPEPIQMARGGSVLPQNDFMGRGSGYGNTGGSAGLIERQNQAANQAGDDSRFNQRQNNPNPHSMVSILGQMPMSPQDFRSLISRYYGNQQPVQMAEGGLYDLEEQNILQEEPPMIEVADKIAPAMQTANPELNALLSQYTNNVADYTPELKQARQDRKASEEAFSATLDKLMSSAESGPSKAEMYYRLAAAFGTPTKTGAFAEGLGQAGAAMADYEKEARGSQTAKRKMASEIALKKQELALESAKDTEKTLLSLQNETNKDKREFIKASVKEYIDSGKPQSEAGRIAKDKGLRVGTPEYQKEVDKQATLLIDKQMAAINAQLLSGQATLAGLNIQQSKEQREAIKLEPDERKAIRDDEDAIAASKSTLRNIDEAINLVDNAFSNNITDKALYRKLKQTNPTDPRVVATEQLENLLGLNVIGSLKSSFGGNPTEGERSALRDLQGLSGASPASRKAILNRAKKALQEGAEHRNMRINKIETGGYRKKPAADKE